MNPQINQPMNQSMPSNQQPMMHQPKSSKAPWIVLAVVVIVVIAVLGYLFRGNLTGNKASSEKLSGYQAVFLTNGQVYFGKASHIGDAYVTLKDIYYLQVNQSQNLQSGDQAQQQAAAAAAAANPELSLVKLGNELHGPADSMQINRQQILFFEDLKDDGKVAQAIASYKKNGSAAPAANAPATTNPAANTTPANTQPSGNQPK